MRVLPFLNLVVLTALVGMSALLWPVLPERLPLHFGLDGTPDRWGDRTAWWWMPALGVALTALFAGLSRWMEAHPPLINIPGKERLLALPPERQRPVLRRVGDLLWGVNALALALLVVIQWSIYQTAVAGPSRGLSIAVVLLAVATGPLILLGLPWVDAELARQAKAHQAETASRGGTA